MTHRYFASAPRGFEDLLQAELERLGAAGSRLKPGGVEFSGPLETGYRACLWSRLAEHVLLRLERFAATRPEQLYEGVRGILWRQHLDPDATFAVTFVSRRSPFTHAHFGALKVKDAVADQFREATGRRPSVDVGAPDVRIHAFAERDQVSISIDLSGDGLHRRGYRVRPGDAPVKETLAAGILLRAGWPRVLAQGGALVDPMCGSGTFIIEGALVALDLAPGAFRTRFGFDAWRGHDRSVWQSLCAEARERAAAARDRAPAIAGFDADARAVAAARENLARAGLREQVTVKACALESLSGADLPAGAPGLVVANPPYGERLAGSEDLEAVYRALGRTLKSRFQGYDAAVLAGESAPVRALELKPDRSHRVFNGPIRCRLMRFTLGAAAKAPGGPRDAPPARRFAVDAGDFANRLRKNVRRLYRWANRNAIDCFRVYDADVPEFALAVDVYRADALWLQVQEYTAPASVDARLARARLSAALEAISGIMDVPAERIVLKRRQRQRGARQYQRMDWSEEFLKVREAGCRFLVNLKDRIDTGLYLDHRSIRMLIRELGAGVRFLNLFAYTGAASVHAAAGGAATTLSVDLSATYSEWGLKNFSLNNMQAPRHRYERVDCLQWITAAPEAAFDLVLLDPPTFSNSKSMRATLDVQRDHANLIRRAMRLLAPGGILIFSNHARRFEMDVDSLSEFALEDISAKTLPEDFKRASIVHRCWRITRR